MKYSSNRYPIWATMMMGSEAPAFIPLSLSNTLIHLVELLDRMRDARGARA